ncbi:acid phosphatase/phosphotransferase [Moraxella macacae 0408225]|uniref:Class B acid phosphatase n=1 Tax=Moraxella macacae 0408225 TaxID=1230338 RepID=L2F634_9GAMM|nr:acid phosphatase AphA [Moraxella macacae]ELA08492.1 acid phosphatase/phosphotransferase [Moraxella macacae 0408225]
MNRLLKLTGCILACMPLIVQAAGPKIPYTHKGITAIDYAHEKDVNWVSVESIAKSLAGKPPMTVSFDIDDTTLVSSHCFYFGKNQFSPTSYDYLKNQDFWNYVANGCDLSSIPKESARQLINMHQARGDQVIFITGRTGQANNDPTQLDFLARILEKTFNIKNMQPVNYTKDTPIAPYAYDKTYYIVKHNVKIHYGDSNDDILAAKEAGVLPIRVIRTPVSTNKPLPINGGYGEAVLIDSSY